MWYFNLWSICWVVSFFIWILFFNSLFLQITFAVLTLFCIKLKNFYTKSVRFLGMLFSNLAVVSSGCRCLFSGDSRRFLRFLPFLFHAFVQKLLGICTKQNIFCTKSGENFSMSFRIFPYFLIQIPDSFVFFSWLFRWKNPFFLIRLPVNDRIYSYQPYIFHAFFG